MKRLVLAAAVSLIAVPAFADPLLSVEDAYARSSGMGAISGAAFMVLANAGDVDDRLVAARADVAERVEIHTHIQDANGVMRMVEVEDGILVPAGESHALKRGGDHIMFMGLKVPLVDGESFPLTLVFEQSGEIVVNVTVDLDRMPMGHGS
jgi:copper(I)-binding protein